MPKSAIDKLLEDTKLKRGKKKHGYVSVLPSPAHAALLEHWTRKTCRIGFSVPKNEYHVTLMYDKRNKVEETKSKKPVKSKLFRAEPANVALYGEKNDILVLELRSPDLSRRHVQLGGFGFKHSYRKFRPHVALKMSNVLRSDFVSAAANLVELLDVLPKMVFYMETWSKLED